MLHPSWHYSAYKLDKQGDNIQPWGSTFLILNQPIVPCLILTIASWSTDRFLRRQVRWSDIPISLRIFHTFFVIHTVKVLNIVNEGEVDVFLEFPASSVIQRMLAIWSLVPLPFLNPLVYLKFLMNSMKKAPCKYCFHGYLTFPLGKYTSLFSTTLSCLASLTPRFSVMTMSTVITVSVQDL